MCIAAVSSRDIIELIASGRTTLPGKLAQPAASLDQLIKRVSQQTPRSNRFRQIITGYCHIAGIESPYSFFAPSVPDRINVAFEVTSGDNHAFHERLRTRSKSEDLRLSALVDQAALNSGPWREVVLQMLAASAADEHPDATKIRVDLTALKFPLPSEYLKGAQPQYRSVCTYSFIPEQARLHDH
jgi:hypothetical protein